MKEVVQFGLQAGHPDADELTAFMEHALTEEARERTLAHLAVCPDCRMVVMLAAEPVEVEARRWWRMPVWGWGLAGAVAAGSLVLVTVQMGTAPGKPAPVERAGLAVSAPPVATPAPVLLPPTPVRQKAVGAKDEGGAVVSGKELAALPAVGRDVTGVEVRPVAPMAGMAAGASGAGVGAAGSPQPAPVPAPASATAAAPVAKLPQGMAGASDSTEFAAAPEELDRMIGAVAAAPSAKAMSRPLPSGLAMVSGASGAGTTLALDGGNHLYVTRDGGAHWVAVAAQWSGKAIRVGLVGAVTATHAVATVDSNASATVITGAALDAMSDDPSGSPVTGVVTDPSGAVIPGAVVTLRDAGTKAVVRTAVTDKNGRYAMTAPAGNYSLEAQKAGFSRDVVTFAVAGKPVNANMGLAVGAESTIVEVQASNGDLQTTNGETAQMLGESKAKAPMKTMARALPKVEPVFELVTENGEHWVSSDGSLWRKK
jgi:hypothetical protein